MHRSGTQHALLVGVVLVFCALAVGACGAPEEEAGPRPLPDEPQKLAPGAYHTEEFEPSFSFRVGKGWANGAPEVSDNVRIARGEVGGIGFANVREVYKATKTGTIIVLEAPEDMVGWFQHHRHLQADNPKPVTVGGVEGEQFDVVVGDLPEDYSGVCGSDCVGLFRLSTGAQVVLGEGYEIRLMVVEDIKGETVTMGYASRATDFDEFAPEARKVIDSVEWRDR